MPLTRWVICCPGKSLLLRETKQTITVFNPNGIIAVNGAVLFDTVKFDYWALGDCEVFDSVLKEMSRNGKQIDHGMTLWVPSFWLDKVASEYQHLMEDFLKFHMELFGSRKDSIGKSMPFAQDFEWQEFTVFTAIALAILKGAEIIRIFGASMEGNGYFIDGLLNFRT